MRRRKRPWRGSEQQEQQQKLETQALSDDEDANADLSMTILAKASNRPLLTNIRDYESTADSKPSAFVLPSPSPTNHIVSLPSSIAPPDTLPHHSPKSLALPQTPPPKKKKTKKKKNKATKNAPLVQAVEANEEKDVLFKLIADDGEDNLEMRKLLRGPRYFDLSEQGVETCFRCGNNGHLAANCIDEARKRACYVCGGLDHEGKDCPQATCFKCKGVGHFAKSCPNKAIDMMKDPERAKSCLRCGDVGHDMSVCDRAYHPDDLKGIQCYVCKKYGHLCCVDVALTSERQDSCYNCGEIGHTGVGCAKSRVQQDSDKRPPKVCYKCGEEGHFARGCSKRDEDDFWDDVLTPTLGPQHFEKDFQGFRSVPAVVEARSHMQGTPFYERRINTPPPPFSRWPECWNTEKTDRWRGHRSVYEDFRFMGGKFSGHRGDYQWVRKDPRNSGFRGHDEAGSSSRRHYRKRGRGQ